MCFECGCQGAKDLLAPAPSSSFIRVYTPSVSTLPSGSSSTSLFSEPGSLILTIISFLINRVVSSKFVPFKTFRSFATLLALKEGLQTWKFLRVQHLLTYFEGWNATDPRDLIYGILGLVQDHGIISDYTKSVSQVYLDASTGIMSSSRTLDFICFNQSICYRSKPQSSYLGAGLCTAQSGVHCQECTNNFSADTDILKDASFSISHMILTVAGHHLDSIASIFEKDMRVDEHCWVAYVLLRSEFFKCCRYLANIIAKNPAAIKIYTPDSPFILACWGRTIDDKQKYAITEKHGYFVAVHDDARVGDEICVLSSASVPLVVRRKTPEDQNSEEYIRLGTAYVHDVMHGEAWS